MSKKKRLTEKEGKLLCDLLWKHMMSQELIMKEVITVLNILDLKFTFEEMGG